MSFSSFLLGADSTKLKDKSIDKGLDDLFRTSTAVAPVPQVEAPKPAPLPQTSLKDDGVKTEKKRKAPAQDSSPAKAKKSKRATDDTKVEIPIKALSRKSATTKSASQAAGRKLVSQPDGEDISSDDEEPAPSHVSTKPTSDAESESDDEGDPSKLVHESVAGGSKSKGSSAKTKYVPPDETTEQRDARTVFVGNVPVDVVKSRPLQKQFNKHILSFVPTAKIESTRFRSVAFQKPTTQLPSDDPSSSKSVGKQKEKEGRQHDRDRAASWRASKSQDDEEAAVPQKTFLTPKEKKRIAFIKQEIHSGVDSVNAYVVFAHPVPAENRPKNLPPPPPVMNPYEAVKAVIKAADGSEFLGRTIRLDFVTKGKGKAVDAADLEMTGDPKATVFVGNLDFACKDEDVRAFFEGLMVAERGAPPEGEDAETGAKKAWVKRVRVIRDKDTLLGKGFGYVQFVDRECVDEVLAMEQDRLKFAKRKLRVQRCKTLPGAPKVPPPKAAAQPKGRNDSQPVRPRPSAPVSTGPAPKGDPRLGEKIASLSKEERKKVKATDADRVARRLAKKQAKALAEKGVKSKSDDKERIRKRPKDKKLGVPEKSKSKKRVRSDKALSKMNRKKQ